MTLAYRTLRTVPTFTEMSRALNSVQSNASESTWRPAAEIRQTEEGYQVLLDVPGVKSDAIDIAVEKDTLTVSGERASRPVGQEDHEANESTIVRSERMSGRFQRSFHISEDLDAEQITASIADGVLTLQLQRKPVVEPRKIQVSVAE